MTQYGPDAEGLLAPLKPWLSDHHISEILINKPGEVYVEKDGRMNLHQVQELTERVLDMLFQLIANENAQRIGLSQPLLSGSLHDGSRVQIVLPPTAEHHTLSIRRKVVRSLSLDDYNQRNFYQYANPALIDSNVMTDDLNIKENQLRACYKQQEWDRFIRLAIEAKKNIVISGGTSSGKTTYLNACLKQIPLSERIIVLEDAREIEIPHPNQVKLLCSKGEQGLAQVSMQTLVQCCLRLRPDRIVMGEIRGKEILDFLSACSTGHEGSITSIHANNPRVAIMRMTQLYKQNNVPSMSDSDILREINQVIDIIVQLEKRDEGRFVQSIYYKAGAES